MANAAFSSWSAAVFYKAWQSVLSATALHRKSIPNGLLYKCVINQAGL